MKLYENQEFVIGILLLDYCRDEEYTQVVPTQEESELLPIELRTRV